NDGEDFARFLLSDFQHEGATVMVAPAEGFYATPGLGRDEVRIAYVLNCDDLRAAVRVFAAGLAAYAERGDGASGRKAAASGTPIPPPRGGPRALAPLRRPSGRALRTAAALAAILALAAGLRFAGQPFGLRHTPHWDERAFVEPVGKMRANGDL